MRSRSFPPSPHPTRSLSLYFVVVLLHLLAFFLSSSFSRSLSRSLLPLFAVFYFSKHIKIHIKIAWLENRRYKNSTRENNSHFSVLTWCVRVQEIFNIHAHTRPPVYDHLWALLFSFHLHCICITLTLIWMCVCVCVCVNGIKFWKLRIIQIKWNENRQIHK